MRPALADFRIESEAVVRLAFADGKIYRVNPNELERYVGREDLTAIQRALQLRKQFIRRVLPTSLMVFLVAVAIGLASHDARSIQAMLHPRPQAAPAVKPVQAFPAAAPSQPSATATTPSGQAGSATGTGAAATTAATPAAAASAKATATKASTSAAPTTSSAKPATPAAHPVTAPVTTTAKPVVKQVLDPVTQTAKTVLGKLLP